MYNLNYYYLKACSKWDKIDPIRGRMPRLIYFIYGLLGSTIIVFITIYLGMIIFKNIIISLIFSYLLSSCQLFYISVKRFHDLNQSGLNAFLFFIPLIKQVTFFYLCIVKGTEGDNGYGLDPTRYYK